MFNRALVIGKFLPPHRGHSYVIETAIAQSHHVVVLVCDFPSQPIPAELRAAWIREIHPNVDVRTIPDIGDDDNSERWASYTKEFLGFAPDLVVTSEDYGDAYAHFLGCAHIKLDRERTTYPVSGTTVRKDPYAAWAFLAPCVRSHFVKRIALVGAESTGKTTLSRDLAKALTTTWVPEYGRIYAEGKMHAVDGTAWETSEFVTIAREQNRLEDHLARTANKVLICDTNAFATSVWHERYMEKRSREVEALTEGRAYDLVIVTGDEIPFEQDGTRDGEHIRHSMHNRFIERLNEANIPFIVVSGTQEERLTQALEAISTTPGWTSDWTAAKLSSAKTNMSSRAKAEVY